ncbi:hypothetical protein HMPREF0868_0064 [Mageeibacillus indolicus UPII9-5]|uniref:Uncharacterized protein n=1 Tax=Mageeibacillus indolicus (strain UPII9-5) TaxID=699246 RepID=D3QZR2_MAGIU|nr:hypothetical protein HMPREF0868_0064 [Mageeibacillus indolicus UPII9-5]
MVATTTAAIIAVAKLLDYGKTFDGGFADFWHHGNNGYFFN